MTELTNNQKHAINMLIQADIDGTPITRLLKTAYSCPFCGLVIGNSGQQKDERKAMLEKHQAQCKRQGQDWAFIANSRTYYTKWLKDPGFNEALQAARQQVFGEAVAQAGRILQQATIDAALELIRQIHEGEKDNDRRLAAVGILDRADVATAAKAKASLEMPSISLVEIVRPSSETDE